jgi:hypothetical protein
MAGMSDMARMMAAGGGGMSADAPSPDMEGQDPNAPEDGPEMGGGGDPMEMVEQGIAMIEGGLESLPGDLAQKARQLLEGLKEIVAQGEAASGTPDDQNDPTQDQPTGGNAGQTESPSEPQVGGSAQGFGA